MKELMLMRTRGLSGPFVTGKAGLSAGKIGKSVGNYVSQYKQQIIDVAGAIPTAWLLPENIVHSSGNVSAWTNEANTAYATGGSAYDLGLQTGTPIVSTHNGLQVVDSDGTANMQSAASQMISQPVTAIMVAKTRDAGATTLVLLDGHTATTFRILRHSSSIWRANAGAVLDVTATDTDVNIHAVMANGASSIYKVYNTVEQTETGDIGAAGFDWLTILASRTGGSNFDGWVGEVILFPVAMTDPQLNDILVLLANKWNIGPS